MKTRLNWKTIREFIVNCLAISMLTVICIFVLDDIMYGLHHSLVVILSVVFFAAVICFLQKSLSFISEKHPFLTFFLQYGIVLVLFPIFKEIFHWYEGFQLLRVFLYTFPVFVASYLLRLVGIRQDAKYINEKLKKRMQNK